MPKANAAKNKSASATEASTTLPAVSGASSSNDDAALKALMAEMIRVDHAGEYAALEIYKGQLAVLGNTPIASELKEMLANEQHHYDTFSRLMVEHQVRPTVMLPLWKVLSFGLGAVSALAGRKPAMAVTDAVEEVIGEHYNEQLQKLGDRKPELKKIIAEFRDDELHHQNTAIDHGAKQAPLYRLMSQIIKTGCRVAIKVSEKI